MPATESTLQIARQVRMDLAGQALTQAQAKLYSQSLRLGMGREGLASFGPSDAASHFEQAVLLIECALIERQADNNSAWRDGLKRAAELLEWLSQHDLRLNLLEASQPDSSASGPDSGSRVPLHLLTAATYQLAGYPALALGHLQRTPSNEPTSLILGAFLRADFPGALEGVRSFWAQERPPVSQNSAPADLVSVTNRHVVMCIGTVCAYLRSGQDAMIERALRKLDRLARVFLYSRDPYSWLLARLTAETCQRYVESSLWPHIIELSNRSSQPAADALVQFARAAFTNRRALVWPAQEAGIKRLTENSSFVLCTPTGSGKTMIATLASIQGLFADSTSASSNLVLYLVPSRALAAEVEARFAEDLRGVAAEPVVVTGLYGGVDWGPTDAWIERDQPTVVICTFEKADALLRYLGAIFLHRVRLVIIDEAHMVDQQRHTISELEMAISRPYRLEQLTTRLFYSRDMQQFRVVALSAVAARAASALARWVSGDSSAAPSTSDHRSTRQMLGRLLVGQRGGFQIRYDLMNGRSLQFEDERRNESPYVSAPFPALPNGLDRTLGPEVKMRAPTLWAALHLAGEREDGSRPSVLISVTQNVDSFASSALEILESWPNDILPPYFTLDESDERWRRCLAAAADYFSEESTEYRLLRRGIAVHHGKMPALLARRLKHLIDNGLVRVIIATSTLSEGVNIPVNYLLIPSVFRATDRLSLQEFTNLIGRAGRPGYGTEGSVLVVLPDGAAGARQSRAYLALRDEVESAAVSIDAGAVSDTVSSPLAQLLLAIEQAWRATARTDTASDFESWLEQTAVAPDVVDETPAVRRLDSLDGFLLSALQEIEELRSAEVPNDELEETLAQVWRRTYAFASGLEEDRLRRIWLARGRTIKTRFPDATVRRRIYKTSLTPRSAVALINAAEAVRSKLLEGRGYAEMASEDQFAFLTQVLTLISDIPSFRFSRNLGRRRNFDDWPTLLKWWVAKPALAGTGLPRLNQITAWYDFVQQNFVYRANWGLGSVLALLLEDQTGMGPIRALDIDDWPRSGLPWIAFWLKELITWGTLDPVVAFLLARGNAIDRTSAAAEASLYYPEMRSLDSNDQLDPRKIRNWYETGLPPRVARTPGSRTYAVPALLKREARAYRTDRLYVAPLDSAERLTWIDPAGYEVATSSKPDDWPEDPTAFDFELDVRDEQVKGEAYLRHR